MISKKMENMVANSSAIRAMFEEGNRLAKIYGPENVFDFSLGNPNVPAPKAVKQAILDILGTDFFFRVMRKRNPFCCITYEKGSS